jgi:dTDP-4-dehydrorhamnose reductase
MMEAAKILVTGSTGRLGRDIMASLSGFAELEGLDKSEFNITDPDSVGSKLKAMSPDVVIHTAAYTDVDGCEEDPDRAMAVNAIGTKHIAAACQEIGAWLVYYSTDYVFDGGKGSPYLETDMANPTTAYGRSKLYGEGWVRDIVEKHTILRVAWMYGVAGDNFVKTMLRLGRAQLAATQRGESVAPLKVVSDRVGNPTWTGDVVRQTQVVLERGLRGLYHAGAEGFCSWYDFAKEIFSRMQMPVSVRPCTSRQYRQQAARPKNSALENASLKAAGANIMRDYKLALSEFLRLYGRMLAGEV